MGNGIASMSVVDGILSFLVAMAAAALTWAHWLIKDLKEHNLMKHRHICRLLKENAELRDTINGRRATCEPMTKNVPRVAPGDLPS